MVKVNHVKKAQKRVDKAVGVFGKAIDEVGKAQLVLQQGIEQDTVKVDELSDKILSIQDEILEIQEAKNEKIANIKANNELLDKLSQFKA